MNESDFLSIPISAIYSTGYSEFISENSKSINKTDLLFSLRSNSSSSNYCSCFSEKLLRPIYLCRHHQYL